MHLCLGKKAFQSGANLTAETFDRLSASIPSWGRGQPSTFLSINISKRASRILAQHFAKHRILNPSVMGCRWVLWQWWWSCPYMKCTYSKHFSDIFHVHSKNRLLNPSESGFGQFKLCQKWISNCVHIHVWRKGVLFSDTTEFCNYYYGTRPKILNYGKDLSLTILSQYELIDTNWSVTEIVDSHTDEDVYRLCRKEPGNHCIVISDQIYGCCLCLPIYFSPLHPCNWSWRQNLRFETAYKWGLPFCGVDIIFLAPCCCFALRGASSRDMARYMDISAILLLRFHKTSLYCSSPLQHQYV